jgi:tRNA(fMet)-specific endonuclease VapC
MSLVYMLDTNASSAVMKNIAPIAGRLGNLPSSTWCISALTAAEHYYGLAKKPEAVRLAQLVDDFLAAATVLEWDHAAAKQLGAVRAALEREGQPIGSYDTLIAAHALARGLVLVTANVREFSRVPGLRVENWQTGER